MIDRIIKLIYAGTRPLVTITGWGTLLFIGLSIVLGIATPAEAKDAAAIVGPPVGIMTAWWFKTRDHDKANGSN